MIPKKIVFKVPDAGIFDVNKYGRTSVGSNFFNPEDHPELVAGRDFVMFHEDNMIPGDIIYLSGIPFVEKLPNGKLVTLRPEALLDNEVSTTELHLGNGCVRMLKHHYRWLPENIYLDGENNLLVHRITGQEHTVRVVGMQETFYNPVTTKVDSRYAYRIEFYTGRTRLYDCSLDEAAYHLAYYEIP